MNNTITPEEYRKLKGGKKPTPEAILLKQTKQYLSVTGWFVTRVHQSLGSQPGIPDIIAIKHGRVIALELKAPKGKLSDAQVAWAGQWRAHGGECYMVKTLEELIEIAKGADK